MDTVFKVIKNGRENYLGASHFGYDNTLLKGCFLLIEKLEKCQLLPCDEQFLRENFFEFDGSNEQDIEVLINCDKREIFVESGMRVIEVFTDEDVEKASFEREELLFQNNFSFDDYKIFYQFVKKVMGKKPVIVNNKYFLMFNLK